MTLTTINVIVSLLTGGFATMLAVELLKSPMIPIAFQRHPRWTAAGVSIVAAVIAAYQQGLTIETIGTDWSAWVVLIGGILLVAANAYNNIVKNPELQ